MCPDLKSEVTSQVRIRDGTNSRTNVQGDPQPQSGQKQGQTEIRGGGVEYPIRQVHYIHAYIRQSRKRQSTASGLLTHLGPRFRTIHLYGRFAARRGGMFYSHPPVGYLGSGICQITQSHHHSPGCNSVTRLHPELGLVGEVRDLPLTHTAAPPN